MTQCGIRLLRRHAVDARRWQTETIHAMLAVRFVQLRASYGFDPQILHGLGGCRRGAAAELLQYASIGTRDLATLAEQHSH